MDNNASERAIRGFRIGKKNWEMIDTINGATSSAIIYSIAETAKANTLKPYEYFEYLLTQIPAYMDDTDRSFLEDLLPWSPKLLAYIRKQKDRGQQSFRSQGTWVGAFTLYQNARPSVCCSAFSVAAIILLSAELFMAIEYPLTSILISYLSSE